MAAGDLPPRVASGELITSAWGNAVVDELLRLRNETWNWFNHQGQQAGASGLYDLGTTALGPFTYPVRVTVTAEFYFGFSNNTANWVFDILRLRDNATMSSPQPIQSTVAGAWYHAGLSWAYDVPTGQAAGFKTRANPTGVIAPVWMGSHGNYLVQRTGTP